jgi:uncharacterized membrane protein
MSHSLLVLYCLLAAVSVTAAVLWVLRAGLRKSGEPGSTETRTLALVAVALSAWYGGFSWLAVRGDFRGAGVALPLAVSMPIVLGLWVILRSPSLRGAVEALPLSWLVGVQFYRVMGVIFVVLTLQGQLPGIFAYPAGLGDVAVGLLALPAAGTIARGTMRARQTTFWWNAFGILDLVVALTMGFLTSPSQLQRFAFDRPNTVTAYPLVMVPVFLVPLSLILHGLCLWRLGRQSASEHTGTRDIAASYGAVAGKG